MNTYTVTCEKSIGGITLSFNGYTRDIAVWAMEKNRQEFRRLVEEFAAQHAGQVVIVAHKNNWVSQTVQIQTTPELAKQLGKVKGIREVSEPIHRNFMAPAKARPLAM